MKKIIFFIVQLFLWIPFANTHAQSSHSRHSSYKGQEARSIKSLSQADIEALQQGQGWGLAKTAELNGVPGPVHLLEMKTEIPLSDEQIEKIEALYQEMKKEAIQKGKKLIELERQLEQHFQQYTITKPILKSLLQEISQAHSKLRFVHLSAHLETPAILSKQQIERYNQLRGYGLSSCDNVPEGHDPSMWKKHNGCE